MSRLYAELLQKLGLGVSNNLEDMAYNPDFCRWREAQEKWQALAQRLPFAKTALPFEGSLKG